jgi:hypothetical protein
MAGPGKNYTIGKGRLYFALFAPGSKTSVIGERYLGNSPELTITREQETLDHIDADEGLNIKDESIVISNSLGGSFSTDNIDPENLAMWFGGPLARSALLAAAGVVDKDFVATRGRSFQIGSTPEHPSGARKINNVKVAIVTPGATPQDPPVVTDLPELEGNVEIDLERGRLYIEPDAPDIDDADVLRVTYDQEATTRTVVIGRGDQLRGSLRFESTNPVGTRNDYFWPYVSITANGDYALKGDEWQVMSFNFEVLKLDNTTERVYIDAYPADATPAVTTP